MIVSDFSDWSDERVIAFIRERYAPQDLVIELTRRFDELREEHAAILKVIVKEELEAP